MVGIRVFAFAKGCRVMRGVSIILGAICNLFTAPFLMSQDLSLEIDAEIQSKICDIHKKEFSRYYWFDFVVTREGFLIDPMKVRFAIIEDGSNTVYPVAQLPIEYENFEKIKSMGIYSIGSGKIESLRCF